MHVILRGQLTGVGSLHSADPGYQTQIVGLGGTETTLWLLLFLYHTASCGVQGMKFSMGTSPLGMWAVNIQDDQLLTLERT